MPEGILLDNDVALKVCAYQCHDELVAATTLAQEPPAMLSIARFTLRSRLSKRCGIADREGAADALDQLLARVRLLDPTPDEIELAAELEEQASSQALNFDTGESQLVALLLSRGAALFITGDKRAIVALKGITLTQAEGRIVCFEQLIVMMLTKHPHETMRRRVCAEPNADKAVTACFACSAASMPVEEILAGLVSYIGHLRTKSGSMLIADTELLAKIS